MLQLSQISGQKIFLRRCRWHLFQWQHFRFENGFAAVRRRRQYFTFVQSRLFLFEITVESIGPFANTSNVQPHVVVLLGSTAQCERMPFVFRNGRNIDENIIARAKVEMRRTFDDQMRHFRWQQNTRRNIRFAMSRTHPNESEIEVNLIVPHP